MTILRRKDQQSEDRYSGVTRRVLTGSDSGSTMLSVGDVVIQPGAKIPYHVHPNVEESMYVAEGDLVMKLDGKSFDISSGDCVLALKGIGHGLENISQNPARLITVFPDVSPEVEQV
ncbi:MAG TPA: cupin domain-containing protein, partial [Dehalococcoidia bacterium]|nr:cupin domain-containing protein [Dehalococcoidia bacterium]